MIINIHVFHISFPEDGEKNQVHALADHEIAPIIDNILRDEDMNMDGYIDYSEFIMSQRAPPPTTTTGS